MSLPSRRSPPDRKINFTKKAIEDLPLPTDAPKVRYHDTKTSCLGLMVYSSGRKVYIFYRKVEGRPEQMTIGRFPDMTIEQARGRVDELNSKVARGINPGQESRALREEMTLGELFDKYLEEYAKVHKKSWKSDEYQFELYLESWKNRKLRSIRREDIQALHGRVGKSSGPYAANRLLALLSTMFTKAIVEWKWNHPHPAKGIRKFREHSRDRFLQGEELGRFFAALGVEEDVAARDLFLLLLLTGARRENVMSMRWEDVDLESKVWRIPETKSGSPQHVPLVPEAVRILVERRDHPERTRVFPLGDRYHPAVWRRILVQMDLGDESREVTSKLRSGCWEEIDFEKGIWSLGGDAPLKLSAPAVEFLDVRRRSLAYVFPGPGKTGHLVEPKGAWQRILKRAKITNLRIHDLRRTLGSWQVAQGVSLAIIGKSLGHKSLQATQVYSRLTLDPVRDAMEKATDALLAKRNPK